MKLIIAYIKPEKLNDVKQALYNNKITRMSITNSLGCGQQKGYSENYRGAIREVNLLKKIRIEIAINDEFKDLTIKTILKSAHTGNIGDGKIFVLPIEETIKIRTKENKNKV